MERRKILLGSGAALATVLAGCSSSETGDDNPEDNDDDTESFGNDTDDTDTDDGDDQDDGDDHDDIPGLDDDDLASGSDKLTITNVSRDGKEIDIVARTETTDSEELRAEFKKLGDGLGAAISDADHFKSEIDTIEWVLEYEGSRVLAVYIDVQWVLDYLEDELSDEEFADKVLETKE